jgi:DNA-binding transcriptional LysR family regulator
MHIENVDLNLLKALDVLLTERHVSRAAERFHLSQSAMSRTLARLRETFGDELLVRTPRGYELTPRGRALQADLADVMPRLAAIVHSSTFDPATATDTVRVQCTDYITSVLGPTLFPTIFQQAPGLNLTVEPLSPHTFDDIDRGRVDLALAPVKPPAPLHWQPLFEEEFVCLLAADHPLECQRVALDDLARYPHARVIALPAEQMLVERRLTEHGVRAPSALSVPYFTATVAALPGTTLIAVLPSRFVHLQRDNPAVRIAKAPQELAPFAYGMCWHPRLRSDPVHSWFRALIPEVCQQEPLPAHGT